MGEPRTARQLTSRQRQILDHIAACMRRSGIVPSIREIGQALGMRSPSTVHQHLGALERKGYLKRDGDRMRVIELTGAAAHLTGRDDVVSLPLLGRVSAGVPLLAEGHIEEMIPVPRRFVGWNEESFLLTVRGDSMTGAGIFDGDMVVVRCQSHATPGEIVVALRGEEATVKRLANAGGRPYLRAENPSFGPIDGEFEILGKVTGLLRRYSAGRAS